MVALSIINSRRTLQSYISNAVNDTLQGKKFKSDALREKTLTQKKAKCKEQQIGRQKVPPDVLQLALRAAQDHSNQPTLDINKLNKLLRSDTPNVKLWKDSVVANFEVMWDKAVDVVLKRSALTLPSLQAPVMPSPHATAGTSQGAITSGGGGDGVPEDGDDPEDGDNPEDGDPDDGEGSGNDTKAEIRTCTATLRQILRSSLAHPNPQDPNIVGDISKRLEKVQCEITKVVEEVSVVVLKSVHMVRNTVYKTLFVE